jgi:NNP family nitrate/nitrite transporter-like MFS transporter
LQTIDRHPSNTRDDVHALGAGDGFRAHLGSLLLLAFVFFVNFTGRIILAPLLPAIERSLHISHAQSGFLFFTLSAGYCLALLTSGLVSSRLTHRRTIILSMTAFGVALVATAACSGPAFLRLGLFVTGMAAGLYLPSGMAAIMSLLPTRHWGKGIAIHEAAPNLSFVLAPFVCEALLAIIDWDAVLIVFGVAAGLLRARSRVGGVSAGSTDRRRSPGPSGRSCGAGLTGVSPWCSGWRSAPVSGSTPSCRWCWSAATGWSANRRTRCWR